MNKNLGLYRFVCCGLLLVNFIAGLAQNDKVVQEYLKQAKDHSVIYNGELETVYTSIQYENTPYYVSDEFVPGHIYYKKNSYPNQRVRLDLYKDQLIVLTPENNYSVVVKSDKVKKVILHNKTFIYHTPPPKSGMKTGYYSLLHDGDNLKLLGRETFLLNQPSDRVTYDFFSSTKYYIFYNGEYHQVKNKRSFTKLFPAYKKQINKFVSEQSLDFRQHPEKSLVVLSKYCEELI